MLNHLDDESERQDSMSSRSNPRLGLSRYALQPSARVGGCLRTPVRLTMASAGHQVPGEVQGYERKLIDTLDGPATRRPDRFSAWLHTGLPWNRRTGTQVT